MRRLCLILGLLIGGCSFIDDFDQFRHAHPDEDPGGNGDADAQVDASDDAALASPGLDAEAAGPDAEADSASNPDGTPDASADETPDASDAPTEAAVPEDAGPRDAAAEDRPPCVSEESSRGVKRCYPDRDRDTFPDLSAAPIEACDCPDETLEVPALDLADGDCWDDPSTGGRNVFPEQERFFEQGYGPFQDLFDYDCDGSERPFYQSLTGGCSGLLGLVCDGAEGYTEAPPPCGQFGGYTQCGQSGLSCAGREEQRRQLCN